MKRNGAVNGSVIEISNGEASVAGGNISNEIMTVTASSAAAKAMAGRESDVKYYGVIDVNGVAIGQSTYQAYQASMSERKMSAKRRREI